MVVRSALGVSAPARSVLISSILFEKRYAQGEMGIFAPHFPQPPAFDSPL